MNSTKDQINHSTATDGKPPVMGSFFRVDGWSGKVHLCTNHKLQPVCGVRFNFPEKSVEVKYIDGELKEKWGDGIVQEIKWVKVDEYRYCERCLSALAKNCP